MNSEQKIIKRKNRKIKEGSKGENKRMIKRFSTSKYVIVFRLNLSRNNNLNYKQNNVVLSESKEFNKPIQIFEQNIDCSINEPVHGIQRILIYIYLL